MQFNTYFLIYKIYNVHIYKYICQYLKLNILNLNFLKKFSLANFCEGVNKSWCMTKKSGIGQDHC